MTDTSPLKWLPYRILSYYKEAQQLAKRQMCNPRFAIIYPTYRCAFNCIGCDYKMTNSQNGPQFTREQFKHVIDECASVGVVACEYCGGGESLMHPDLADMIEYAHDTYRMSVGILTSGTPMSEHTKQVLIDNTSYIRVSVEAATSETFAKYKRTDPKMFDVVINNIKDLIKLRGNNKTPQISYKFAIDQNNYQDVYKAANTAFECGVDSLQYKLIRNVPSEITDEAVLKELRYQIAERTKQYPEIIFTGGALEKTHLEGKCWMCPVQFVVTPDGYISHCCYFRQRQPMSKHFIGNVFEKPLRDIWFSDEHWKSIDKINPKECQPYDCRFHGYNKLMKDLVVDDTAQLRFI